MELWELDVHGKAWRIGMDYEKVIDCKKCKRTVFPNPTFLTVDESKWDGSDVLNVDLNPNIVLVTEKVCNILDEYRFKNYQCIPV